jgi:hypothetical protein
MKSRILSRIAIAGLASASVLAANSTLFAGGNAPIATAADENEVAHSCAGLNECKGLGGCKVTAEKLAKLAKKAGVEADKAGEAHSCAGLNECKGLGGCKVTKGQLEKMKSKMKMKK